MPVFERGPVYWIDFRYQGKRYRRPVANAETDGGKKKAKQAAEDALTSIKARIAAGTFDPADLAGKAPTTGVEFGHALDLYLASRTDKGKTLDSYKRLEGDWRRTLAGRSVHEIGGDEIEATLSRWTKERALAPATRNNALAQLSGFFSWCLRRRHADGRRWITHHPIRDGGVERFAVDNKRERWLRPDEIARLRAASPAWLAEVIVFACGTGMRLGEVCSLTKASYQTDATGRPFLMTERTKNGERLVWPLEGAVKELVERRRKACKFPADPLFPGPGGGRALIGIRRELPGVVAAAGLEYGRYRQEPVKDGAGEVTGRRPVRDENGRPVTNPAGITFHVFRHSMASLAINGGIPASTVQRMGNWKTRSMLDRYAHLGDDTLREAAGKLAKLVGRGHKVVTVERARNRETR